MKNTNILFYELEEILDDLATIENNMTTTDIEIVHELLAKSAEKRTERIKKIMNELITVDG